MQKSLSRYWLLLGTLALAIAGLFSLVLVIARTPQLASIPLFQKLFHEALVVHVDLSVLVWFLCIACLLWSRLTAPSRLPIPYIEESALLCFLLGTLAIACSSFDSGAQALMSNYIPVIHSPVFFIGLMLICCGTLLMIGKVFASRHLTSEFSKIKQYGLFSAAVITLIAIAAFVWSLMQMPPEIEGEQYYELAFWGGGHLLQFTHTQILMVCWLLLFSFLPLHKKEKYFFSIFTIGLLAAALAPFGYIYYDVTSQEHRLFFTHLMIWGNGIAPAFLAVILFPKLWNARDRHNALWAAFFMSLLLFVYGGVLGGMIERQNVIIPAHYHGSIVGVTLGFMGVAYLLLPQFGYQSVERWKLAYWQPVVYGVGQLMHISGLAWSGGYGVLRKTPGEVYDIAVSVKVALGFMGFGGLIAIIGGFMFVVVIAKSVLAKPATPVAA